MSDVRSIDGGRGLCEGPGKIGDRVVSLTTSKLSTSTPTSRRLQPRTRGNGAIRRNKGGTFHGKIDRCRESQGWTTAAGVCANVTERTEERIDQSKRARAGSLALVD